MRRWMPRGISLVGSTNRHLLPPRLTNGFTHGSGYANYRGLKHNLRRRQFLEECIELLTSQLAPLHNRATLIHPVQ